VKETVPSSAELTPPILLVAMPQVVDPFFHKTVVLLVHHDPDGSLGFIVNRPTSLEVGEVLEGLELVWHGPSQAVVHFGGPVQKQLGTVLFVPDPAADPAVAHAVPVGAGLYMSQHVGDLDALARRPPSSFRLLLGYAGWGEGQLVDEILRNDWLTVPVSPRLVFPEDAEATWEAALATVGVDPTTLPSWTTAPSNDEAAN
jgi:putative transcriptional regulator